MAYQFNPFSGNFDAVTPPAGGDTELQFNDGGKFGASSDLTWDETSKELSIEGEPVVKDDDSRLTDQREPTDGSVTDAKVSVTAAISGTKVNPDFGDQTVDTTALASLTNLMIAFALRGKGIGTPGEPLYGVGPAVVSDTPVGIGPHDFYPIDLASGSFM